MGNDRYVTINACSETCGLPDGHEGPHRNEPAPKRSPDDWQARALAAEAHASRLADALADEVAGRVAAEVRIEKLEQELADVNDEGPQSPEWRRMMETRTAFLSRAIAAEADVARLRENLRDIARESAIGWAREHARAALAATPTPPLAVAALVRAARAITTLSDDEPCYGVPKRAVNALAALLDAPPWRALR